MEGDVSYADTPSIAVGRGVGVTVEGGGSARQMTFVRVYDIASTGQSVSLMGLTICLLAYVPY